MGNGRSIRTNLQFSNLLFHQKIKSLHRFRKILMFESNNLKMKVGKLPVTCDDYELKKICHRAAPGFQLVRVKADIDPVTGCCKTTGQITVRYSDNQMLDDLIVGLQSANLHVEI